MALGVDLQRQELKPSEISSQVWPDAAKQDPLTGLNHRRAFMLVLEREHQRALRTGRAYIYPGSSGLGPFQACQDSHGHAEGDEVLKAFAALMLNHCRTVDTVARMGGEEFAILLPECSALDACAVLERLRAAQENAHMVCGGNQISVTSSMGSASFRGDGLSATEVLALADNALYAAKASGRNRVVVDELASKRVM